MSGKNRVLVVDDELAILRFLKPALEANDYEMYSVGTVADALKQIEEYRGIDHQRRRIAARVFHAVFPRII